MAFAPAGVAQPQDPGATAATVEAPPPAAPASASASSPAPAPPPPAASPADDDTPRRLYALIDDEARRQHRQRMAGAGLTFGLAALIGGAGIACFLVEPANKADASAWTAAGAGFEIIAGLSVGLGFMVLFMPTDIEKLAREYEPIAHDPKRTDRLSWGEVHLGALAERERQARVTSAVLSLVLAPITLGAGIALAALQPSGTDDAVRAGYVALFASLSLLDLTLGIVRLFELGPVERLWHTWRIGTSQPIAMQPWIAPVMGGAASGVTLAF